MIYASNCVSYTPFLVEMSIFILSSKVNPDILQHVVAMEMCITKRGHVQNCILTFLSKYLQNRFINVSNCITKGQEKPGLVDTAEIKCLFEDYIGVIS